jgi:hypothetical protein
MLDSVSDDVPKVVHVRSTDPTVKPHRLRGRAAYGPSGEVLSEIIYASRRWHFWGTSTTGTPPRERLIFYDAGPV